MLKTSKNTPTSWVELGPKSVQSDRSDSTELNEYSWVGSVALHPTLVKKPIFKRGVKNELVQHPLHIWFITSGCLENASGTFLYILLIWSHHKTTFNKQHGSYNNRNLKKYRFSILRLSQQHLYWKIGCHFVVLPQFNCTTEQEMFQRHPPIIQTLSHPHHLELNVLKSKKLQSSANSGHMNIIG